MYVLMRGIWLPETKTHCRVSISTLQHSVMRPVTDCCQWRVTCQHLKSSSSSLRKSQRGVVHFGTMQEEAVQAERLPAAGQQPHLNVSSHNQDWHNVGMLRISADLPGVRSTPWSFDFAGSLDSAGRN